MQQKGFHRKLAAILNADVAGCSRLMQDDEAATATTLAAYKLAFFDLIKQHRGRVVDSPGDNLLAEFASVVDAVQCAVAVQKELQARTAELPENRRILFRIGVNLGDVIQDFFGDGLAEEIINALAKLPQVFVIARNSSFVYREKAEELAQKTLASDENLAEGHAFMGRIHTQVEAAEVLRIDPKFSLDRFTSTRMYNEPANAERFHAALRRAGIR